MKHSPLFRFFALFVLFVWLAPVAAQDGQPLKTQNPQLKAPAVDRAAVLAATEEIFKDVSQIRELDIKHKVKSGFRTRDELEKDVISDMNESTTPEEFAAQTKLLVKLGLVPAQYDLRTEMIKILGEQIGGFYRPKTGEFFLTDRTDLDEQKIVIAHELTHALQDQHFNLRRFEKFPKGQSDHELAVHALIEGDATVVMFDYFFKPAGRSITQLPVSLTDLLMTSNQFENVKADTPTFNAAPKWIKESLMFPYFGGAGFVQKLVQKGGWATVSKAYTKLPESSEQILHPEKYFADEHPTAIVLAPIEKNLGKDWKIVTGDVDGEFGLRLILGEFLDKNDTERGAEGWSGDFARLYENTATKELLLVHHTAWDEEVEAQEFFDLYRKRTEKRYPNLKLSGNQLRVEGKSAEGWVALERKGNDVLIIEGASDQKSLVSLAATLWKDDRKEVKKN
ncbi:MAG: hypothetical protein K1Y36_23955 [Blastocatellia bacterium]|nr:hypothetical protein [Blastocatellia bacterium]